MMRGFLIGIILIGSWLNAIAQKTVVVKKAESLALKVIEGKKAQKLRGDVWMIHENTNIRCDSAYFFKETNSARAFGHVTVIDEEDGLNLKGDYLEYDGNTRIAKVRDNVILKDDSVDLYTDYLDFNRNEQVGYYLNGGKLVDSTNVLTSIRGYYNTETKDAQFVDSVYLDSPDYKLSTDTLDYSTLTKIGIARGKTQGNSIEGDTVRTNAGMKYNSQEKWSEVYFGKINTEEYVIEGDSLYANDKDQYYTGDLNVKMTSKPDSLTLFGQRLRYYRNEGRAVVYDDSYLRKLIQGDSLFIKGDTLVSVQDSVKDQKYLTAYKAVEMFKSDLQARADSVSYNLKDSTIYMYQNPVIWNIDSQIEADSINIEIANNKIHKMNLSLRSFVITQDSLLNFNQVKGRDMEVYFRDGFIQKADVNGNGESIYFAIDKKDGSSSMNKLECSNMTIYFENSLVTELRTYKDVDGNFVPPVEIREPEKRLRGFNWKGETKPKLLDIALHLRKEPLKPTKQKLQLPVKKG